MLQLSKDMLPAFVPEHGFAEYEAERHLIQKGFENGRIVFRGWNISVRPSPKIAVTIAAVMALQSETERFAVKASAIKNDVAAEGRVRVWRSREPDPTFAAHRELERRTVSQSPGDLVSVRDDVPATGILADVVFGNVQFEWTLISCAETQGPQRAPAVRRPQPAPS